jgi:ABC-2 type transport system ATP-binding protein
MIVADHLTRRFGARVAVEDVSFEVGRSEIVALLGPNGAGKTTTLRMLAGLISPSAGSVTIDGTTLATSTAAALRTRIGFLTETPGLWDRLSVRENLRVYSRLYGLAAPDMAIDRSLTQFGLTEYASTPAAELSKGTRQKAALARALLHDPKVLLLDEPTSGLDPEIRRSVRRLLEERRAEGCSILVSTHNLDEAERIADRVAVLDRRLLALDRTTALRRRLTTGRLFVRLDGDVDEMLPLLRRFDPHVTVEDGVVVVRVAHLDRDTPAIVAALAAAGARVLEVRPEMPPLEDVYMHLVGEKPEHLERPVEPVRAVKP